MHRSALVVAAVAFAAAATPATAPADTLTTGKEATWAFVAHRTQARDEPRSGARVLGTLTRRTEDRTSELVLIEERVINDEGIWVKVRLPFRPAGQTGWVRRDRLGEYQTTKVRLKVDLSRLRLTAYRRGRPVFRTRVGVGKPASPTPTGRFYVRNRVTGFGSPIYGPLAFGTSAKSEVLTDWPGGGVIGIHGTNQPGLIPGRPSHGCIRLRNQAIRRLGRIVEPGAPLDVVP